MMFAVFALATIFLSGLAGVLCDRYFENYGVLISIPISFMIGYFMYEIYKSLGY